MATCPTCHEPMLTEWPHRHARQVAEHDGHTIEVGYVHTGRHTVPDGGWECSETCPHPDHDEEGN